MIKKFLFVSFLTLFAGSCCAQAGLTVTNGDGKLVGWLLGKVQQTDRIQLLTPQGYQLTVDRSGQVVNSMDLAPTRVLYELPCPDGICSEVPCDGQPWVETNDANAGYQLRGEIMQIDMGPSQVFVAVPWSAINVLAGTMPDAQWAYQKGPDGVCVTVSTPPAPETFIAVVNEINPADYGIQEYAPGAGWFLVPGPFTYAVERPDGVFCNGFEACTPP